MNTSLVPVFNGVINNIPSLLCNARDLHGVLGVGRDFSNWIKGRIEEYRFTEGEDFSPISAKSTGGRKKIEYHLTIGMGKELAMLENNDKGRIARRYFIECERNLHSPAPAIESRPEKPKPGLNPNASAPDIAGMLLNHDKLEEPDPRYPFPPVIEAQIRRKAEQLTRQAGDVIEEHIRRRVFGQSFQSWNKKHSEAMAVNAITHCTLENAMAYKYYAVLSDAIGWMGRFARVATRLHGQAVTDQLYVSDQR